MSKIISFAWTTPAIVAKRKTVTRREWNDKYAKRFKVGDICQPYDKNPMYGGKPIKDRMIRIVSVKKEDIKTMPNQDFEHEGFAYLEEQGLTIWGKPPRKAFEEWREEGGIYWVVRFEYV